jgi:hypothetical protein
MLHEMTVNADKMCVGRLKEGKHLGDLRIDGKKILNWNLEMEGSMGMWVCPFQGRLPHRGVP